jgi:uncharacterized protein YqeY
MGLKDKLERDLKDALRNKDEQRKATLRLALSSIHNAEIAKGGELDESEVIGVLSKEAKQRRESVEQFAQGGRDDLVAQEKGELEILMEYLPAQLSEKQIEDQARAVVKEVGATGMAQMGEVMRVLMPQMKGKADGQVVSDIVKKILSDQAG